MTRISLELDEATNVRLKQYCLDEHPTHPYGQQQAILRRALNEFLDRNEKKQQPQKAASPTSPTSTKIKPIDDPVKVAQMEQMIRDGSKVPAIHAATGIPASTIRSRRKAMQKKGELPK